MARDGLRKETQLQIDLYNAPYSALVKCSLLSGARYLCRISCMEGLTQVRSLRRERGLTQQELGRRCGLSRSFLSQVENGNRVPSLSSLTRISAALGIMHVDVLIRSEQETSER